MIEIVVLVLLVVNLIVTGILLVKISAASSSDRSGESLQELKNEFTRLNGEESARNREELNKNFSSARMETTICSKCRFVRSARGISMSMWRPMPFK